MQHGTLRNGEKKKNSMHRTLTLIKRKKKEGFTWLDSILAPGIKGQINKQPALGWVFLGREGRRIDGRGCLMGGRDREKKKRIRNSRFLPRSVASKGFAFDLVDIQPQPLHHLLSDLMTPRQVQAPQPQRPRETRHVWRDRVRAPMRGWMRQRVRRVRLTQCCG